MRPSGINRQKKRRSVALAQLSAAIVAAFAVGWAAATVFTPNDGGTSEQQFDTVVVARGEVGVVLPVTVSAEWRRVPAALNLASGMLTSVDLDPQMELELGQQVYSVNLRPVVVGEGDVPAFETIQQGYRGAHVAQLQHFLSELGYFDGKPVGEFDARTTLAVRAWQENAGFPVDGIVQAQDIVWLPTLGVGAELERAVFVRGTAIEAGSGLISILESEPTFTVAVTGAQAPLAPEGSAVSVTSPQDNEWPAMMGALRPDESSADSLVGELRNADGTSICGENCNEIAREGRTTLRAEVISVAPREGLVVAAAAIRTDAEGNTSVIDVSGNRHSVSVVQSARGMALVEGVDEDLEVIMPAMEDPI